MLWILAGLAQLADTNIGIGAEHLSTRSRLNLLKGPDWCLLETKAPGVTGTYTGIYGQANKGQGFILSNSSWSSFNRGGRMPITIKINGKPVDVTVGSDFEETTNGKKTGTLFIDLTKDIFLSLFKSGAKIEFLKGDTFLSEVEFDTEYKIAYIEFSACLEGATDPFASSK